MSQELPFIPQETDEYCGAAALAMVYQSYGVDVTQQIIWEGIASNSADGGQCAHTNSLAMDALRRGFAALILRAKQPWKMLEVCDREGIRAILNLRIGRNSHQGHYAVLFGLDGDHAVLHDPQFGGKRRVSREELLDLWEPLSSESEITGNVLLAIAPPIPETTRRCLCSCEAIFPLEPWTLLQSDREDRLWESVFCPVCDQELSPAMVAAPVPPSAPSKEAPKPRPATPFDETDPAQRILNEPPPPKFTLDDIVFPEPRMAELEQLPARLDEVIAIFADAAAHAPNAEYRNAMNAIIRDVKSYGPKFIEMAKAQLVGGFSGLKESVAQMKATQKEFARIEAMHAAAASEITVPPPPPKIDPKLGAELRRELLDKVQHVKPSKPAEPKPTFEDWAQRSTSMAGASASASKPTVMPKRRVQLSVEAEMLLGSSAAPLLNAKLLSDNNLFLDGLKVLAYMLPPREGAWWCLLAIMNSCTKLGARMQSELTADLEAAARWAQDPSPKNFQSVRRPNAGSLKSPGDFLAVSILQSDSMLADPSLPRSSEAIVQAIVTTANLVAGDASAEVYRSAIQFGIDVAQGKRLWKNAAKTPPPAVKSEVRDPKGASWNDWINESLRG